MKCTLTERENIIINPFMKLIRLTTSRYINLDLSWLGKLKVDLFKKLIINVSIQENQNFISKKKQKRIYAEAEGPSRGFSERGWKENLPRGLSAHSPWELLQQSLIIIVAAKAIKWRITKREMTHVFSFLWDNGLKNGKGSFCSLRSSSAESSTDILGIWDWMGLICILVWSLEVSSIRFLLIKRNFLKLWIEIPAGLGRKDDFVWWRRWNCRWISAKNNGFLELRARDRKRVCVSLSKQLGLAGWGLSSFLKQLYWTPFLFILISGFFIKDQKKKNLKK